MTCFLSGGAKSGKSSFAQELAVSLSDGGRHYYVATMISTGEEDDRRVRRHIADRAGLGFETLECGGELMSCLQRADKNAVFLVDSVTALLQNALFSAEKEYRADLNAAARCTDELIEFARTVRHAVFASDYIYSDAERYSDSTELYRKCLAEADRRLSAVCDTVIEISAGRKIIHKGKL